MWKNDIYEALFSYLPNKISLRLDVRNVYSQKIKRKKLHDKQQFWIKCDHSSMSFDISFKYENKYTYTLMWVCKKLKN